MGRKWTALVDTNSVFLAGLRAILQDTCFEVQYVTDSMKGLAADPPHGCEDPLIIAGLADDAKETAESIGRLRERLPKAKIMILADRYLLSHLTAVMQAGADGYQLKSIGPEALIKSLDLLVLGQPILPPLAISDVGTMEAQRVPAFNGPPSKMRPLSEREKEILGCLVQGATNKVIARRLDITEQTVKVHVKAILRKIHVRNRTQAAIWAVGNVPKFETAPAIETSAPH